MMRAVPKADELIPMRPVPVVWVLVQTTPHFAVLATADSRERLHRVVADLAEEREDSGATGVAYWAIEPANHLVS